MCKRYSKIALYVNEFFIIHKECKVIITSSSKYNLNNIWKEICKLIRPSYLCAEKCIHDNYGDHDKIIIPVLAINNSPESLMGFTSNNILIIVDKSVQFPNNCIEVLLGYSSTGAEIIEIK